MSNSSSDILSPANAEVSYMRALRAAETVYGQFHGEVGLVLLKLAALYRRQGRYLEAQGVEDHIAEITTIYEIDLEAC